MFRVSDLEVVNIVTADLDDSVATFRRNFGFPVTRSPETLGAKSVFLGIGPAEIEIATPTAEGAPRLRGPVPGAVSLRAKRRRSSDPDQGTLF